LKTNEPISVQIGTVPGARACNDQSRGSGGQRSRLQ